MIFHESHEESELIDVSDTDLSDAFPDLKKSIPEAEKENFPIPSELVLVNAYRILTSVHGIAPGMYEVYPTPDGEIAIDAPGGYGRTVVLFCDSDGGFVCPVNMEGRHRRAHCSDAGSLPDSIVRKVPDELNSRDMPSAT